MEDVHGNDAAAFTQITVTNTVPELVSDPAPSLTFALPPGTQFRVFFVTFNWSEDVTGFALADIDVTNGTASNFAGSGDTYTADITPDADVEDDLTITIPADAAEDSGMQGNVEASATVAIDTLGPTVDSAVTNTAGTLVTVTMSEPLTAILIPASAFILTIAGDDRAVTSVSDTGVSSYHYTECSRRGNSVWRDCYIRLHTTLEGFNMPLFTIELNRLADSVGASDLTIRLHTAAPTNSSPTNGRTTTGGGSFSSGETLADSDISNASNGDIDNDVDIDFGTATADVGTVIAWSAYRGSSPVSHGTLASTLINDGDSYKINANSLQMNSSTT